MNKSKLIIAASTRLKQADLASHVEATSIKEVAEFLGISVPKLNRWMHFNVPTNFTKHEASRLFKLTGKHVDELFPACTKGADFFDRLKDAGRIKVLSLAEFDSREATFELIEAFEEDDTAAYRRSVLNEVLAKFPTDERMVISLRYFPEDSDKTLSVGEIGRRLKISSEDVRKLMASGLARLGESKRIHELVSTFGVVSAVRARKPSRHIN